jgi:hypothetical protein
LHDAATQFYARCADAIDRADDIFHQLIDITRAAIGQFPFGQRPDPLIGIEFRGVRGKMLHVQTWVLPQELLQWFSLVSRRVIEQNNDWAA